jgi:hypothetical protein
MQLKAVIVESLGQDELIERILTGNGRPPTAVVKKRDGMMSEETAKPETSARLTRPQARNLRTVPPTPRAVDIGCIAPAVG